jgi:Tfp pilus assembly protein PilX
MKIKKVSKHRAERGATLFTVILLGVILAAIGASTFLVSSQLSNRTVQERGVSAAFQIADSAAEYVRDEYIKDKKASGLSTTAWLTNIGGGTRTVASLKNSSEVGAGLTAATANVKTNTANLIRLDDRFANTYRSKTGSGAVAVRARVFASNPAGTFTVKTTVVLPDDSEQTVVKGFAATEVNPRVPLFAVLSRNINCAFCHVQINGDTGALSHVRPGWDVKGSCTDIGYDERTGTANGCTGDGAINSTNAARGDTRIKGNLLGLQRFTDDVSSNNTQTSGTVKNLNGIAIEDPYGGSPNIQEGYSGDKFNAVKTAGDLDGDGISNDIPPVDLDKARIDGIGKSITVSSGGLTSPDKYRDVNLSTTTTKGGMYLIPTGSTYSSIQQKTSLTDTEKSGTLILVGTKADPINIPENFYFNGDIILKGYVSGNGNVTASRNTYIAGEVIYKNPPGTNGNYNSLTSSAAVESTAESEKTSKDSLRLFAGGNAIIGDYTNKNDAGTDKLDVAFRQPETFIRQQFGLDSAPSFGGETPNRYFNKSNGEELNCVKNNAELPGPPIQEIGTVCVKYLSITGKEIASTGVTSTTAQLAYDYVAKPGSVQSDGSFKQALTDKQFRDILGTQTPKDKVTARNDWLNNDKSEYLDNGVVKTSRTNITNSNIPGILYNYASNSTNTQKNANATKVNTKIANQVERVDAYVYANRRIAGIVRGTSLQANGGFVTKEFGILATAVESSKNGTNITAASTACVAGTTTASDPNSYCNGLNYGVDKNSGDSATDGTGLQINYDNRLAYYKAPLGSIPVGTVTFFRLGTLADRTF